jgi:hypothetical protein
MEIPQRVPWLRAIGAGMLTFLASWAAGIVATLLIIRSTLPAGPAPDDPTKGVGDAMMAVFWFYLGTALSFFGAVFVGYLVAVWVICRRVIRDAGFKHAR